MARMSRQEKLEQQAREEAARLAERKDFLENVAPKKLWELAKKAHETAGFSVQFETGYFGKTVMKLEATGYSTTNSENFEKDLALNEYSDPWEFDQAFEMFEELAAWRAEEENRKSRLAEAKAKLKQLMTQEELDMLRNSGDL